MPQQERTTLSSHTWVKSHTLPPLADDASAEEQIAASTPKTCTVVTTLASTAAAASPSPLGRALGGAVPDEFVADTAVRAGRLLAQSSHTTTNSNGACGK